MLFALRDCVEEFLPKPEVYSSIVLNLIETKDFNRIATNYMHAFQGKFEPEFFQSAQNAFLAYPEQQRRQPDGSRAVVQMRAEKSRFDQGILIAQFLQQYQMTNLTFTRNASHCATISLFSSRQGSVESCKSNPSAYRYGLKNRQWSVPLAFRYRPSKEYSAMKSVASQIKPASFFVTTVIVSSHSAVISCNIISNIVFECEVSLQILP
jgi:hypothetical protein